VEKEAIVRRAKKARAVGKRLPILLRWKQDKGRNKAYARNLIPEGKKKGSIVNTPEKKSHRGYRKKKGRGCQPIRWESLEIGGHSGAAGGIALSALEGKKGW